MVIKMEVELPIPNYPGYFATANGKVISYRRGKRREMKQSVSQGYLVVSLFDENSNVFRRYVHQVILEAHGFFRTAEKNQVRHIDNNPLNNNLKNIEWATQAENYSDRFANGTDMSSIRQRIFWSTKDCSKN